MRFAFLFAFLFIGFVTIQAQENTSLKPEKQDQFIIDILWETFDHRPGDLKMKWYNYGINLAYMYDAPVTKNVSFAIGLGYSNQNYYSNSFLKHDTIDDGSNNAYWEVIEGEYRKYKVSVSTVEMPIELRFRSDPHLPGHSTKIAVGLKPGYVFDVHDKFITREKDKYKTYIFPTIEEFRLMSVVRIGYGKVSVTGGYSFTPFFQEGNGPEMHQINLGISLMPF